MRVTPRMPNAKNQHKISTEKIDEVPSPLEWVGRIVVGQWGRTYAEALQTCCSRAFPRAEVSVGCTGAKILEGLRAKRADLLLLALVMPDIHGVDLLKTVANERLALRVLVVCHQRDERTLLALRDSQFDGLLDTQEEPVETLVKALHMVAAGRSYVSEVFRDTVVDRDPVGVVWQKLTPAEIRVFSAIGDGTGNEEAAQWLKLSEATVQTHRRNLMHKLGISSSAKLVREAIRLGFVRILSDGKVIRPGLVFAAVKEAASPKDCGYPYLRDELT